MTNTILTAAEVQSFVKNRHFPPCKLTDIEMVERAEFRKCLGNAFWTALYEDLEDYSSSPEYDQSETAEGETVLYEGLYYTALSTTTSRPDTVENWVLADKFQTDLYNQVWCRGLGGSLSWQIIKDTAPISTIQLTGDGLVRATGENYIPATQSEINFVMRRIDSNIAMLLENADYFMRTNNSTGVFDLYKGISNSCCATCGEILCSCVKDKSRKGRNRWG